MSYVIRFDDKYTVDEREKITEKLKNQGIKAELISDEESCLRDKIDSILETTEPKQIRELTDDEYKDLVNTIAETIYKDDASFLDDTYIEERIDEELEIIEKNN